MTRLVAGQKPAAQHVAGLKLDRLFRDAADALNQTRKWDDARVALWTHRRNARLTAKCGSRTALYNSRMCMLQTALLAVAVATVASAQQSISFPAEDGGRVCADLYGPGTHAVVLAHGGRFNKESWRVQANALVSAGFRVLAIDFRGFGCSTGPGQADFDNAPFEKDVLAAVRYLKTHGAKAVSVVGGSFGGAAAGDASIKSAPGEIDRIVFLGAAPNLPAEKLKSRALFIVARDDANDAGLRLPGIRAQYEKAPGPKELIVLDGSAHAQFLFQTDQRARVMQEILRFLSMP